MSKLADMTGFSSAAMTLKNKSSQTNSASNIDADDSETKDKVKRNAIESARKKLRKYNKPDFNPEMKEVDTQLKT